MQCVKGVVEALGGWQPPPAIFLATSCLRLLPYYRCLPVCRESRAPDVVPGVPPPALGVIADNPCRKLGGTRRRRPGTPGVLIGTDRIDKTADSPPVDSRLSSARLLTVAVSASRDVTGAASRPRGNESRYVTCAV
jgi:hypothetical protein